MKAVVRFFATGNPSAAVSVLRSHQAQDLGVLCLIEKLRHRYSATNDRRHHPNDIAHPLRTHAIDALTYSLTAATAAGAGATPEPADAAEPTDRAGD